jgi:hypothetical protein
MAEQHGPVATYSCLAIEYVTTPPGSPVYRVGYTAPRFPRKAPGVVQIASPPGNPAPPPQGVAALCASEG